MECLIFGTLLGQVWTKLAQCLAYHYSYQFSQTICQSVGFLKYLLKFYSGGAVDLWSCFALRGFYLIYFGTFKHCLSEMLIKIEFHLFPNTYMGQH